MFKRKENKAIVLTKDIFGKRKKRIGRGFSINELKEAGITLDEARKIGIYIDFRRRSKHIENIEKLKELIKSKK
ncbi:MAG: ribosomal protein L13e [Nitrososphaerota archaeon]